MIPKLRLENHTACVLNACTYHHPGSRKYKMNCSNRTEKGRYIKCQATRWEPWPVLMCNSCPCPRAYWMAGSKSFLYKQASCMSSHLTLPRTKPEWLSLLPCPKGESWSLKGASMPKGVGLKLGPSCLLCRMGCWCSEVKNKTKTKLIRTKLCLRKKKEC